MDAATSLVRAKFTLEAWVKARTFLAWLWHSQMVRYVHDLSRRLERSAAAADGSQADQLSTDEWHFFPLSYSDSTLSSLPLSNRRRLMEVERAAIPAHPDGALHLRCSDIITNKGSGEDAHPLRVSQLPPLLRSCAGPRSHEVRSLPPGEPRRRRRPPFVRFLPARASPQTSILVKCGGEVMFAQPSRWRSRAV
jgi:hypothetical protein